MQRGDKTAQQRGIMTLCLIRSGTKVWADPKDASAQNPGQGSKQSA